MKREEIERQVHYVENIERKRRQRAVMFGRFCANIKRPIVLALAVLSLILGWAIVKWMEIPFPGNANHPMLVTVWESSITFLILIISMLLSLFVFTLPPLHSKAIEAGLEHIHLIDRYGLGPILISSHRMKDTNIRQMDFYSRGIAKEVWESRRQAIEDVLNVHWVDEPQYGGRKRNKRNYIVLLVAPGAESKCEEPLYDDEL